MNINDFAVMTFSQVSSLYHETVEAPLKLQVITSNHKLAS